ncbi:MAG: hypothetical protein A2843_00680 [Candidatus Wildermuthbacteria bacterium RIFCSPHIGHO2_01_FULL_48_27b]|uniref:APS kinase domain-containing protein n=1 Tax=Candidatus Wildermuthbacteria bacterium RIFCSPHIGHO2_01_FULL_48_27b TaxID=1802447 RepID=A0A1G2QWN2_9BACT|nr:MAG: hypothetical protein A2843_00680 [Candidatus Wildermuthbacteria bacterium RIFCSPHIGHO2_01_FULL_48_27b]OHD84044.1 MAG: hypothetical protein A3J39_09590 [Sulfuricurvum sp. RIFCSPHIGHO2_12_FULL_44_8]
MVIWFIGISGAGKTTLGKRLQQHFDAAHKKSFLIDGNAARAFFNNDLGYSKEDRIANVKRITFAAHVLSQSDVVTIVCCISPFESLRALARKNIRDYNEIYLERSVAEAKKDDVQQMYQNNLGKTEIVGIDLEFEAPKQSDLVIRTDEETEDESFEKVLAYLQKKYPEQIP